MDDMFILYKKFRDIKVTTTNGYTYSTDDICHRGGIPDTEGGPIFPCFTSDTFQCFSEYLEATHPTYQALDPILDNISALAGNAFFRRTVRPVRRGSCDSVAANFLGAPEGGGVRFRIQNSRNTAPENLSVPIVPEKIFIKNLMNVEI